MPRHHLRLYQETDVDQIVDLSLRAWQPVFSSFEEVLGRDLFDRFYPDWREQQATSVRDAVERNESWVSVTGAKLTGFVNVTFDTEERAGEIYMIAVDPDFQRQGIATALTRLALREMRRRGLTLATVATGGDPGHDPARRTYEKLGFTAFPQVLYSKTLDPDDEETPTTQSTA